MRFRSIERVFLTLETPRAAFWRIEHEGKKGTGRDEVMRLERVIMLIG